MTRRLVVYDGSGERHEAWTQSLRRIESMPGGQFRASPELTAIATQVIAEASSGG